MDGLDPVACSYLTVDLPGVGGTLKQTDEDFQVEEIPLYEPSGQGTHVYFAVEKAGLTTWEAVQRIARALGRNPRDFGYAGLKDAHAVTRQMLSIEHAEPSDVEALDVPRVRVLWTSRHTNKLKIGHLRGNGFTIRVRERGADAVARAEAILTVLAQRGVPNYFGTQRFGTRGNNASVGFAVLTGRYDEAVALICGRPIPADQGEVRCARERFDRGDYRGAAQTWPRASMEQRRLCLAMHKAKGLAERAWRAVDRKLCQFYLSALQSELFNRAVADRVTALDRLYDGDVAWKHANGACFGVTHAAVEQPRCDAFEISPTGPLFGRRMKPAAGLPGEIEARVLAGAGLSPDSFAARKAVRLEGSRRPLRFQPRDWSVASGNDVLGVYLRVAFTLEAGCYATTVMREVCKNPSW